MDPIHFAEPSVEDTDVEAVTRVLRGGWITTGAECAALEEELAAYLGAPHVVAVSSCTAAIEIAYASCGLAPGARVGVPTWTFVSSATAPMHQGAVPVLLDVDPGTLNLAPESLDAALDAGLDALVAVHFGGSAVAAEVHERCAARGVPVVEDAAHALGSSDHRGRLWGAGSVAAAMSFYATKNLTCAEGGALTTADPGRAAFARSFRLHGMSADAHDRYRPGGSPLYDLVGPGLKANLPDVLAAMARSQLRRFDALQAQRRRLVERYRLALATIDGVTPVPAHPDPGSADHLMVVLLPERTDREGVIAALRAAGVGTSVHFRPLHRFGWLAEHSVAGPSGLAGADSVADRTLSLPLHPGMAGSDVDRVAAALGSALHGANFR